MVEQRGTSSFFRSGVARDPSCRDSDLSTFIPLYSAILVQCASCSCVIRRPEDLQLHELLGVPSCDACARTYNSMAFALFEDEQHETNCRCCGKDGGELVLYHCDSCPQSFCR